MKKVLYYIFLWPFISIYGLLKKLKNFINSDPFLENIVFSTINIIGNLLPLLIVLLLFSTNTKTWQGWKVFYEEGQFYLYSTSMLTSVWYILYTNKKKNYDWYSFFLFITSILGLGSSLLYAFLLTRKDFDINVLKYSSISIFIITVIFYYVFNFISIKKANAHDIRAEDIDKLMKGVRGN